MASEKTEQPTQRRRQKAREEGQISRSVDLTSALSVLTALIVLGWAPAAMALTWRDFLAGSLNAATGPGEMPAMGLLQHSSGLVLRWTAPALAAAWAIAVLGSVGQGGLVFTGSRLTPKISKLNPVQNVKNMFSPMAYSRLLKSLIPAGAMAYVLISVYSREWAALVTAEHRPTPLLAGWLLRLAYEVGWKSGLILLCWSAVDYLLQKKQLTQQLKMTKDEVKRDHKETEGNPQIKGKLRGLRRQLHRQRMLAAAKRATVVIVNPSEFAVALRYDVETMPAPVVVAKGRDHLAREIKEIARWNDIPMVENRPLARALYRSVEVGRTIPAALFTAVAEILAFIYAAQARAARRRPASAAPAALGRPS